MAGIRNKKSKAFLVLAFILILASLVVADFLVSVDPVFPRDTYFENERIPFEISIVNLSQERQTGVRILVEVSDELVLIENQQQTPTQVFLIPELAPNQSTRLQLVVKPIRTSEKAVISVSYGQEVFSRLSARIVRVVAAPVRLLPQQSRFALEQGEVATLYASFFNDQNHAISNLKIELITPPLVDNLSRAYLRDQLAAGATLQNMAFEFWPKPLSTGEHELVLVASFVDKDGPHELEKRISVKVDPDSSSWAMLLLLVLVVLIIYYASTLGLLRFSKPK